MTEETNNAADHQFRFKLKLRTVEVIGRHHKFHVELVFFPYVHQVDIQKQIRLFLLSFNETTKRKGTLNLPLHTLPWLRKQMAEMLVKYDGTEEIAKEAPTQIPQKFFIKGMLLEK